MAGVLLPSWNLVRVHGTWVMPDGSAKMTGQYQVTIPGRLTNSTDDAIIPAGTFLAGDLSLADGVPSLDVLIPATDDPDIEQSGWKVSIRVSLGSTVETYVIDVPLALSGDPDGINLRTIALTSSITPQVALYGVGTPGGLAKLSTDGTHVVDADGNAIIGGDGIETMEVAGSDLVTTLSSGNTLTVTLPSAGVPGTDGRSPEFRISGGFLQYRLVGDTAWVNLTATTNLQGAAGPAPEIRVDSGWVQWRTTGTTAWTNLVALSSLTGPAGSVSDLPVYTTIEAVQADITSGALVDGDILLLET